MNDKKIVFSPHAKQRFEEIADYLYQQQLSKTFVYAGLGSDHSNSIRMIVMDKNDKETHTECNEKMLPRVYWL